MLLRVIVLGLVGAMALRIPVSPNTPPATNKASWSGCCLLGCAKQPDGSSPVTLDEHSCHQSKNQKLVNLYDALHAKNEDGSYKNQIAARNWDIGEWLQFLGDHEKGPKYVFQVGSYGKDLDEVYPLLTQLDQWHGVIAEASPYNIDKLKVVYADELSKGKLQLIHSAVTDVCKNATLNFIAPNAPYWEKQPANMRWKLGTGSVKDSIVGDNMMKWGTEEWQEFKVPCSTTTAVMDRGNVPNSPDFVQVDAEAHDARILMGIDFNKFNPKVIRWESLGEMHAQGDVPLLLDKLFSNGYVTIQQSTKDPFAVRADVLFTALEAQK